MKLKHEELVAIIGKIRDASLELRVVDDDTWWITEDDAAGYELLSSLGDGVIEGPEGHSLGAVLRLGTDTHLEEMMWAAGAVLAETYLDTIGDDYVGVQIHGTDSVLFVRTPLPNNEEPAEEI